MTSKQHVLKIHPAPLADLLSGAKTAEVRRNDRGFQVGDTVALREVNPFNNVWTGRPYPVRTISHIQTGYGLPEGVCVLSYAQPAAGEPVYQWLEGENERWWTTSKADYEWTLEHRPDFQVRILWTAPPAAAPVAAGEPVGKIVAFGESLHEVSWHKGKLPPLGTELWAAPPAAAHGELVAVVGTVPDGSGFKSLDFKVELESLPDGTGLYAAAHGDAAAAYVAMSCNSVLIDGSTCYYLPAERMAAFDRMFSLGDAMRAQAGEGGEV